MLTGDELNYQGQTITGVSAVGKRSLTPVKPRAGFWLFLALGLCLAGLSVSKYANLNSTFFDLGVFQNHLFNLGRGNWERMFFGHAHVLMPIWGLGYSLIPEPLATPVLLILQALALSLPTWGIYNIYGKIPALAYALYFPVWYNALFDFHFDHLAVLALFGFFFLERSGRFGAASACALLLCLIKELFALQTLACGLYLFLFRKNKRWGIVLVLVGFVYFWLATSYLIPHFSPGSDGGISSKAFSWMGVGIGNQLGFLLFQPHRAILEFIANPDKWIFLAYVFGTLGFIPLLSPRPLLVALPVLAASLLSREPNYYSLYNHYTAGLIAPMIIAFAEGSLRARRVCWRLKLPKYLFTPLLLLGLVLAHAYASPSPLSQRFWSQKMEPYNRNQFLLSERSRNNVAALEQWIPKNPDIVVSTQNSINWGSISHRRLALAFPQGVQDPVSRPQFFLGSMELIWAEYVVLDLKRPWFIVDKGCSWKNGKCQDHLEIAQKFAKLAENVPRHFKTVHHQDGFFIFQRTPHSGLAQRGLK